MIFRSFFICFAIIGLSVASTVSLAAEGRGHRAHAWMETLTTEQRQTAERILAEVQPRVQELRMEVRGKMMELHSFSYRNDEDRDVLSRLGRELQVLRDKLREELQALDSRLVQEVGMPPRPSRKRSCSSLDTRSLPQGEGEMHSR